MVRKSLIFAFLILVTGIRPDAQDISEIPRNMPVIEFQGNKVFSLEKLRAEFNSCLDGSSDKPDGYSADVFDDCRYRVLYSIRREGYFRSSISDPKVEKTESGTKVSMLVDERELYRLGQIEFEGLSVFSAEQLLEMLSVKKGDIADGEAIGHWLYVVVKKAYADYGYIQYEADVDPEFASVAANGHEGVVNFKIEITEGLRFIVGKISIIGNMKIPDQILRNAIRLDTGESFNQQKLIDSIYNLNDLNELKWVGIDKDVELVMDERDQLVDVRTTVEKKGAVAFEADAQENCNPPTLRVLKRR